MGVWEGAGLGDKQVDRGVEDKGNKKACAGQGGRPVRRTHMALPFYISILLMSDHKNNSKGRNVQVGNQGETKADIFKVLFLMDPCFLVL